MNFSNLPQKAAVYARVSTDEQADKGTIESQIDFAHGYCNLNSISVVKIYLDDGITGTLPLQDRPAGAELLADAKKKLFQSVLVYKLDRLGRSTRVILNAVNDLELSGVRLKSMTEPFDTSDASGRFLLTILAGVADLDRSNILERMWLGANRAAAKGQWVGGIVPYGYVKNEDKYLEISEEIIPNTNMSEADVIRLIYKLCGDEGKSTISIAEHLNALHIPTTYVRRGITGKRHQHVSGNWLAGRVRNMLVSTLYKGIHQYGRRASRKRELIERTVPAIVSADLWERAQKTLKNNQLLATRNAKNFYLLKGLVKCKNCGLSYQGSSPGSNGHGNRSYYVCGGQRHYRDMARKKCMGKVVRMTWLDDWIWEKCLKYINDPQLVCKAIINGNTPQEQNKNELNLIEQKLKMEAIEKERLVQLYTTGLINMDDVSKQINAISQNHETLERRKEELLSQEDEIFSNVESAEDILGLLRKKINSDELSQELKGNIIRTLVKRIDVFTNEDGKIEITAHFKFKDTSTTDYSADPTPRSYVRKTTLKHDIKKEKCSAVPCTDRDS